MTLVTTAEMDKAGALVSQAKRSGVLVPQPCQECGAVEVEAHHDDYSKPLDVIWLCVRHHRARHKQIGHLVISTDLRIHEIDPDLMAQLKSKAALAKKTLGEYVTEILKKAVRG